MKDIFLVDSHCHLNYEGLNHRIPEIMENATKSGVKLLQSICTKLSEFEDIYKIALEYPGVFCSVGVHPHDADHVCHPDDAHTHEPNPLVSRKKLDEPMAPEELVKKLVEYAAREKTIGIGETGLDYYYENSAKEKQKESFALHMEAASQSGLPIIIHTRDAEDDTYNMMKDFMNKKPLKGLLHCFTGTSEMAAKCMELGFYVSISGIVTFKNAVALQETVRDVIPMDRLLVETDSPFLAPNPHRGKKCEPAFTRDTAEFIAKLKGISLEELAEATTANFLRLFDKVKI